jgi:hypothetical protein
VHRCAHLRQDRAHSCHIFPGTGLDRSLKREIIRSSKPMEAKRRLGPRPAWCRAPLRETARRRASVMIRLCSSGKHVVISRAALALSICTSCRSTLHTHTHTHTHER